MSLDTRPRTSAPPRRRRSGRRSRARQRRRRRTLLRLTLGGVGLVAGVVGLIVLATIVVSDTGDPSDEGTIAARPVTDRQPTLIIATIDEAAPRADASMILVLARDVETDAATVVLVPPTTVGDIPGHGILQVGRAHAFGGASLLDATLDNLLGVDLDHVAAVSQQGWASFFTRLGGLTIDVPERLTERAADGSGRVRFQPGEQFLDGPRLAEYITFIQEGDAGLTRLPRLQQVLVAAFEKLAAEPDLVEAVFADGAPMFDSAMPADEFRSLLVGIAEAATADDLVVRTLPVTPIGSSEDDSYRIDAERVARLVAERFAGSVPTVGASEGRSLQVLNGNGLPGIGAVVAERLIPAGFRVVLTGNADTFDHETTRIIVFDDDPGQLSVAREIQTLLGIGQIEISRTPQSVVDITIVVGADFTAGEG